MSRFNFISALFAFVIVGAVASVGQSQSSKGALRADGPVIAGMGINARHPTDTDLDGMRNAGFRLVRTDLSWNKIEGARGVYDWQEADHRIAAMAARDLRPILILDYSNPLYAPKALNAQGGWMAPRGRESVEGFVSWAATAAKRYARYKPVWELWNEPDTDGFWAPKADPDAYIDLAENTCKGIREVDGGATIWGPALSSWHDRSAVDSAFLRTVLDSPLPSCLSAISVHPYARWQAIDQTPEYWSALRALPTQAVRPFVASENGISNYGTRITGATQASYIVRMFLYDHLAHVPVTVWYDWRNDGTDPMNAEHNYGLVDAQNKPKPAYVALATLVKQTAGLDHQCLVRDGSSSLVYAWRNDKPGQLLMVAWSTVSGMRAFSMDPTGDIEVDLTGSKGSPSAVDLYGRKAIAKKGDNSHWQLTGGQEPYYIQYKGNIPAACS